MKLKKVVLIALSIVIVAGTVLFAGYIFLAEKETENPKTTLRETNTNPTLYTLDEQKVLLERYSLLYDASINAHKGDIESGMYIIPGLIATKNLSLETGDVAMATTMTPQGITMTEDYILISAYSHVKEYNSVIYVLDRNTHKYIKTIILEGKPHTGGIAYDPQYKNILVCGNKGDISEVISFSLKDLEAYDFDKEQKPIAYTHRFEMPEIKKVSFITYHEGNIYVGLFTNEGKSVLEKYAIDIDGKIKPNVERSITFAEEKAKVELEQSYEIAGEIQGITFYENNLLLSRSNGPFINSEILIFEDTGKDEVFFKDDAKKIIEMPERLEQIYVDESKQNVFAVFESASFAYRALAFTRVDRVLQLDIEKLLK